MVEYQLIRSKRRKTLGLQVKNGQVIVRAPQYVTVDFIDAFILAKSAWLTSKVAIQNQKPAFCDFCHQSPVLYLGLPLQINVRVAKKANVFISNPLHSTSRLVNEATELTKYVNVVISERVDNKLFDANASAKQIKKQLEGFFKTQAEQVIRERLESIVKETDLTPTNVNIRQYSARWGSCNSRGEVSFNYLLMMTPLFVIDYVITHELCHLIYLNHSSEFWLLVEKHFPRYKEAKAWLKSHQSELSWQKPH